MSHVALRTTVGLILLTITLSGCRQHPQEAPPASEKSNAVGRASTQAVLARLKGKVFSKGPNGETPVSASEVKLGDAELTKIKSLHATAAIVLHYSGNDWSRAQVAGLKFQFGAMGISIIAITDAGFKPEKQVADLETVLVKKPSVIVSIPTDPVATAGAFKKAADAGVKLIFMDNVPKGLVAGTDYVSVVSADNYGNGAASAALLAEALGGTGNIGLVYHGADFFVTRERYNGFKKTLAENFPDIKIVAEQGIGGPDFSGDGERAASAMITSHRNLDGIWAVWDVPAEGVIAAARSAGRDRLVVTTCDLGENVAIDMARGGFVKGLGAQRPFDQGVTEALLAGYGLLGKKASAYVALPALPVTKDTLLPAWKEVYHQDPPTEIKDSIR
jgi:ribose transport system substrate-binding protein